jgi:hypothetical protein
MHQVRAQGPLSNLIEKYGRKGNLMKWKEQLNGDCPRRDSRLPDRCDLVCPDLAKVHRRSARAPAGDFGLSGASATR